MVAHIAIAIVDVAGGILKALECLAETGATQHTARGEIVPCSSKFVVLGVDGEHLVECFVMAGLAPWFFDGSDVLRLGD